jgi:GH15 family glucan-1,4-alpha-glucosidase
VAYEPIESYGLIGDMRTAVLVGMSGSIDWLCFPYFDSPSVFAAILDDETGGRFVISPVEDKFQSKPGSTDVQGGLSLGYPRKGPPGKGKWW